MYFAFTFFFFLSKKERKIGKGTALNRSVLKWDCDDNKLILPTVLNYFSPLPKSVSVAC